MSAAEAGAAVDSAIATPLTISLFMITPETSLQRFL
jgi:hypothetical protein